jgi:thiol-disulfide isomerase/thioredoxin/uncharacterized membrane protein YphA (DoxX/SURF4 family)
MGISAATERRASARSGCAKVMVGAAALAARVVLAAVFAVAGVAKLADRSGSREAVVAFGAPRRIAGVLAVVLPIAELTVAVLLLPASTAVYGAIEALVLLAIFSLAIGWNLAHGRSPECHCFGQLHSEPAGWKTLGRNAVLGGLALFALAALAEPATSATAWIGRLDSSELMALVIGVVATLVLVVGSMAFLTLMRSYGRILVRLDRIEASLADAGIAFDEMGTMPEIGLEPGTPSPVFQGLDELLAPGLPALLLFTSTNCMPCKALFPRAAEWQREHGDALTVAFASDGDAEDVRAEAEEFELEHVFADEGRRIYESFQANGTPSAILIAADGTIGSWVAVGSEWIEQLVAQVTAETPAHEGLPMGTAAPEVELPSLDGKRVSLAELRGRDTLLLFWNPDCGFCRSMHDDVLAWEKSANGDAPQLVVVSSGDAESTREEGFSSLVLLDESFSTAGAFNANGTPMAVLVDAEGRIASSVAAGADAVLALVDSKPVAA